MTHNIQAQQDFYDKYWQDLKPLSSYKVKRTQWILNQLLSARKKHTGELKLLDLGCGDGRLAPLWQSVTGADTFSLDLSPNAMKIAAEKYPTISYTAGDATNTTYDDQTFDIIVCQELLEHIAAQKQLISECARIIKHNGTLILTTPNKYYFDRRDGGNYSQQPIENIIDKETLLQLLSTQFTIMSYETLIYAKGDKAIYRFITNRYLLAILRRVGLEQNWKNYLLKKGYGLHMAVVCEKK